MTESVRDARGAEIKPGDVVVYVSGGRYVSRLTGRVAEVRKRVRLDRVDMLGRPYDGGKEERRWIEPSSCFVVEWLPEVDDRLNTERTPL